MTIRSTYEETQAQLAVRPRVADLFQRFYPNYRGENEAFGAQVLASLSPTHVVLDAGCGSGHMSSLDFTTRCKKVIGVDICDDLKANGSLHHAIAGTLESLPLRSGCIDLILCRYVVEHLAQPLAVFKEFARVLRKGGRIILLTPNQWHYVSLISRSIPFGFHRLFNLLYGVAANDTFPTFYRANTQGRIRTLAEQAGLRVAALHMFEASPNYLEFSRILYRLGIAYERLVNRWAALAPLRVNIIATLEKPFTHGVNGVSR